MLNTRVEFHRNAVALMPQAQDAQPGVALLVLAEKTNSPYQGCSCSQFKSKTCDHIIELSRLFRHYQAGNLTLSPFDKFHNSLWHVLAKLLWDTDKTACQAVKMAAAGTGEKQGLEITGPQNQLLVSHKSNGMDKARLIDRLEDPSGRPYSTRANIIDRLKLLTLSDNERELARIGMQTRRQALEDSFWYRMAYHAFRELGTGGFTLAHRLDEPTGQFRLSVRDSEKHLRFEWIIPKLAVSRLMSDPAVPVSPQQQAVVSSRPVKPVMKIRKDRRGTIRLSPVYVYAFEDGRQREFTFKQAKKLTFGTLFHIPKTDKLAPVDPPGPLFKAYGKNPRTTIPKREIPAFLQAYGHLIRSGSGLLSSGLENFQVFNAPRQVEISPNALDRDWCWLSAKYRFGESSLSLDRILAARQAKQQYISIADGWVDVRSAEINTMVNALSAHKEPGEKRELLKIKRMHLFQLLAATGGNPEIRGETPAAEGIRQMLRLKPDTGLPEAARMTAPLRAYQSIGAKWLWFLYENGFGGLLCDDMGLGKTHQVMALMLSLKAVQNRPLLVVCPTTVISHWENKIHQYAPSLEFAIYHGPDRNLETARRGAQLLITSYGVVLRDIGKLAGISFALAVFDEIQHIKNARTKSFKASAALNARMKIGLTGTPIENSLWDLKAMLDLVMTGYLGSDAAYKRLYVDPVENTKDASRQRALARAISPFTLRRLKATVLTELPEKIEDVRYCQLSAV